MFNLDILRMINIIISSVAVYYSIKLSNKFPKISIIGYSMGAWAFHRVLFYVALILFDIDPVIISSWSSIIILQGSIAIITSAYTLLRKYGRN